MPLYLCRWENGDFSIVHAKSKDHALDTLDEIDSAEGLPLYPVTDFMAHFRLTDEGTVELEGFGEEFGDHVRERVHPFLGGLDSSPFDPSPGINSPLNPEAVSDLREISAQIGCLTVR